jgi:hypothetical protein
MAINNTRLTGSAASSIYTSSNSSAITTIHLCNTTGATVTCNVYIVPSGSTAGSNTAIYTNLSLTAQNTYVIYAEKFILDNGDTIQANCSAANSVTATISSIGI